MPSANETVRHALLRYPTLFSTPFDVLHHLYLVIGNAHQWRDGALVDGSTAFPLDEAALAARSTSRLADSISQTKATHPELDMTLDKERLLLNYAFTVENLGRVLAQSRPPQSYDLYPCSPDHAKIFSIPDDAASDWLLSIRDFIRAVHNIVNHKERDEPLDPSSLQYRVELPRVADRVEAMLEARGVGPRRLPSTPSMGG